MIVLKNDKGSFHLETMKNILWSYRYEGYENIDKLNVFFTITFVMHLKKASSKQCATQFNKYECTQNTIVPWCKMISLRILPLNFNPIFLNTWWFDTLCGPSPNVKHVKLTFHELSMNSSSKCLNNFMHVVMLALHHRYQTFHQSKPWIQFSLYCVCVYLYKLDFFHYLLHMNSKHHVV